MVMTSAQRKATSAFKKKLTQSKKHVASGGSKYSWSTPTRWSQPTVGDKGKMQPGGTTSGSGRSVSPKVTEVYPGQYQYRDPKTGKLTMTGSKEFAETSSVSGTPEFTQEFQKTHRSGGGRISTGSRTPQAFESEQAVKASYTQQEKARLNIQQYSKITPAPYTTPTIDYRQQRYIDLLKTDIKTEPSIQAYGGVVLPYGQKDITWFKPQFGSVSSEYPSGYKEVSLIGTLQEQERLDPDVFKPTNVIISQTAEKLSNKIIKEETEKSQKVIDDSVKKIQDKIDNGEVSLKEGQRAIVKIQTIENKKLKNRVKARVNKEVKEKLSTKEFSAKVAASEKFRDTFKTSFSPEYKTEQKWGRAELGGDILAGAISGIAPPVGIAWFAGKGFYKAAKGAEKDIRMIDVSPSGELITPRYMGLIPSEQSREAGYSFLFAGASGLGYTTKIGQKITALRKAELIAKPWTVTSKELGSVGDKTFLKVSGSKVTPFASAEGSSMFPVQMERKVLLKY